MSATEGFSRRDHKIELPGHSVIFEKLPYRECTQIAPLRLLVPKKPALVVVAIAEAVVHCSFAVLSPPSTEANYWPFNSSTLSSWHLQKSVSFASPENRNPTAKRLSCDQPISSAVQHAQALYYRLQYGWRHESLFLPFWRLVGPFWACSIRWK